MEDAEYEDSEEADLTNRDSPTSSILKTPTHTFLSTRGSSRRTKKLTFASGHVDLETLSREGSQESTGTSDSGSSSLHTPVRKATNGDVDVDGNLLVAISPINTMKVSPESWSAFQAYKKYEDFPNETEKTDYTYSRLSRFKHREIVPGFVSPPNLSRCALSRSLPEQHKHTSIVNTKYDYTEMYNNYLNSKVLRDRKRFSSLTEDETDVSYVSSSRPALHTRLWTWVVSVVTVVVAYLAAAKSQLWSFVTSAVSRLRQGQRHDEYKARTFEWSPMKFSNHHYVTDSSVLRSWYERVTTKLTSVYHTTTHFVTGRYSSSSRKHKLLWFLIPLLLLAGLWLYKAECDNGYVTASVQSISTNTYKLLPNLETIPKAVVRAPSYLYYKFTEMTSYMGGVIAYGVQDSWTALSGCPAYLSTSAAVLFEKVTTTALAAWDSVTSTVLLMLRGFTSGPDNLATILSRLAKAATGMLQTVWNFIFTLAYLTFGFLSEYLVYVWNVLSDACVGCCSVIWQALCSGGDTISTILLLLVDGVSSSGLHVAGFFTSGEDERDMDDTYQTSTAVPQELFEQHKAIAKLSREMKDLEHMTEDLMMFKLKLEELEEKLRAEKEDRLTGERTTTKAMDDQYKTLQQYQVRVNHALRRCCQRSQPVQQLLHSESDRLKQWISANYWSRDEGLLRDEQIATLVAQLGNVRGAALDEFKAEFAAFVKQHRADLENSRDAVSVEGGVSEEYVKRIVKQAITLYDADKTGKVDYALESSGGQVKSIRCTETYIATSKSYFFYGWPVYTSFTSPREAINPGSSPGQCWAFVGSQGYLVLLLSHTIVVTGFTLEHVSRLLVPNGHIRSAPKNFSMWGLQNETDAEPYLFGKYEFLDNDETLQFFPVQQPSSQSFQMVEIKITANHGNPDYTCLYRLRVHGKMQQAESGHMVT